MGATIGLDLDFIVEGQGSVVKLTFADIETMLEVSLTNFTIYAQIDQASIGDVFASDSQIGDIDTRSMKTFLNLGLKLAIPLINVFLAAGISFPQSLFGGLLVIKDASFNSY